MLRPETLVRDKPKPLKRVSPGPPPDNHRFSDNQITALVSQSCSPFKEEKQCNKMLEEFLFLNTLVSHN
ncbi:hypothetical protein OUZ56_032711 [Daphnia magna]|uniref:Uncharacterized protein n=1 Tax=Daphnia magna TaxID=35525 RepID=A0ABQ9ZWW6_9CRUS|nr:hypothetical protein OUZ56_032711 [Daphnia magna]